ncbi:4-coumarate--CoA ligase [Polymorphobacter glacialis]|uniref:4-coumarate--CoA ligase n=1 Tax=Sandarakinorhabdus glacialis TaxID=1614636 RepID=A0A917E4B4_9SPHN|nr:class I adenylate-forming enzyme family protein [Polymorphobacter glacialis]GGE02388.1 4-coumarate--CoA ligase [Polymorphobacter glacialis]
MNTKIAAYVARPCGNFADLVALQARAAPDRIAIICDGEQIDYAGLNARADCIAASLQRDGVVSGGVVAICAASSIDYAAIFIATLRAGAAIAPLSPSATPAQLAAMIADSTPSYLFVDAAAAAHLAAVDGLAFITLGAAFDAWLAPPGTTPTPVEVTAEQAFNIIYSSGTTGTPKGIVQSFAMRWPHNHLGDPPGYGPGVVAVISTPLYSNTTLVSFLPTLAGGGTMVLMPRFDAREFLVLSERHHANIAMLVPVQYRRILDVSDFDAFDLSSYRMKYATSAPFSAELKAEVLQRWPGGLVEYYGMTEGGGSCMLVAHEHPDKLHTVGRPMDGHEMLVIDADGNAAPPGVPGEVVGRSRSMMNGYRNQPEKSAEAEWFDPAGVRYIRTGDIASVDAQGFFTLIGRAKDMIISGGINLYPIDLESVLNEHPAVIESAVVGVASREWGETPVAFVTMRTPLEAEALRSWANQRLGKMQRISAVQIVDELPRNAIGKIVKRALQDRYAAEQTV